MSGYTTPDGVHLDPDGVEITTSTSGGKGGQHANRAETRVTVTVRLRIALAAELAETAVGEAGEVIRASSAETRSQWRNRELALAEALRRVDAAISRPEPRRSTKVPAASRRTRREEKARRTRRLADRRARDEG